MCRAMIGGAGGGLLGTPDDEQLLAPIGEDEPQALSDGAFVDVTELAVGDLHGLEVGQRCRPGGVVAVAVVLAGLEGDGAVAEMEVSTHSLPGLHPVRRQCQISGFAHGPGISTRCREMVNLIGRAICGRRA